MVFEYDVDKKYNYLMITHHVHEALLDEDLARTGLYQWLNVFEGKIKYYKYITDEDLKQADIIHINLSAQDINIVNSIRERIGYDENKRIVVNNDYTTELWVGSFDYFETIRREVNNADMVFGTEPFQITSLSEVLHRKVYLIQHPCHVERLQTLTPQPKEPYIGVLWHRYDRFAYVPWLAARNHNLATHLLGYDGNSDPKRYITETMYDFISGGTNFQDFCKQLQRAQVIYEPFTIQSIGRATIDTAALKVPVVGSNRVDSVRRCYPHTSINPYDTKQAKLLINKILTDEKFKKLVIDTASKEVEYYNHKNRKKAFLEALKDSDKERKNRKVQND